MPKSYEQKYEEPDDLSVIFQNRLDDLKYDIKVQLPCKVHSINHEANTVSLEILDYDHDPKGNLVNYPVLPDVPIRQPMDSGVAYIRLPIQEGDIGTIEIFDTSMDDLLVNDKYEYDTSEVWHSINNGLFTNGFLPKGKLFQFDYNSKIIIGTKTNKFVFKVNANDELEVVAEKISITSTNGISINAGSSMNITSDAVSITAPVSITGAVTVDGEVTGNGIALSTHTHSGVTSGGESTGGPQ